MFESGDDLYLTVPGESQFASVQVTFKNGTKSSVQKVVRENQGAVDGTVDMIVERLRQTGLYVK